MSFVASGALIIGAGVASSAMQADAAGDAARAQVKGNNAAIAEQRRQFDLIMQMLQPQRQAGLNATNAINRLMGFGDLPGDTAGAPGAGAGAVQPTGGTPGSSVGSTGIGVTPSGGINLGVQVGSPSPNPSVPNTPRTFRDVIQNILASKNPQAQATPAAPASATLTPQAQGQPDMSGFFLSPDYNFRRTEGTRSIENSFAAGGGARSGNALRALADFNSNLAAGEYGNYFNRLASVAGMGQVATGQGVGAAQTTGNNVGNALMSSGNARASGIVNRSNAWSDLLNSFSSFAGYGGFGG